MKWHDTEVDFSMAVVFLRIYDVLYNPIRMLIFSNFGKLDDYIFSALYVKLLLI